MNSASIPQYLIAVRQMQLSLTGEQVPTFPFLPHVMWAYRRWEEANFPQGEHRLGLPASLVQQAWFDGMAEAADARAVRDAAMLVFSYCLNGLRESSVLSLLAKNIDLSHDRVIARLSVVNGQVASEVAPVSYTRLGAFASPLDLWMRWQSIRGRHARWFGLPGESRE